MQTHNTAQTATDGPTDEFLLSEVRQGRLESFGLLYERYVSMARAIAYKHTSNKTLSEDIVSEAFVRVLQALKNGKGPRTFMGGYLATTIAHLAAENGLTAQKEIPSEEEHLESMGSLDETVLKLHESDELISAFTGLPERWQTVLWMTEVENKKPREVAQTLNLSANAVSALAVRARESLREGFLRAHQKAPKTAECAQYSPHLSSMVRGSLTKKRSEALSLHLSVCSYCTSEYLTLAGINKSMRVWVFPVLAGLVPFATDGSKVLLPFLAGGLAGSSAAGAGAQSSLFPGLGSGGRWTPASQALVGAAAVVTAIGAVAGGMALMNNSSAGSAVISADSQLQNPQAQVSEEAKGITDSLVNEPQSVSSGMSAETLRASVATDGPSSVQGGNSFGSAASANSLVDALASETSASQSTTRPEGSSLASVSKTDGSTVSGASKTAVAENSTESFSQHDSFADSGSGAAPVTSEVSRDPSAPRASEAPAAPVEHGNPSQSAAPVEPTPPVESQVPSPPPITEQPVIPVEPVDPEQPVDPVEPVDPEQPVTPEDPVDPVDPEVPVDPVETEQPVDPVNPVDPIDPEVPVSPVDPVDPVDPEVPVEPTEPEEPANPIDPDTNVPEILGPQDWVGTPEYYDFIAKTPWDTIGHPSGDNRMCVITFLGSDFEGADFPSGFATYLPPIIIDSPYATYILESYFGISRIQDITCY